MGKNVLEDEEIYPPCFQGEKAFDSSPHSADNPSSRSQKTSPTKSLRPSMTHHVSTVLELQKGILALLACMVKQETNPLPKDIALKPTWVISEESVYLRHNQEIMTRTL